MFTRPTSGLFKADFLKNVLMYGKTKNDKKLRHSSCKLSVFWQKATGTKLKFIKTCGNKKVPFAVPKGIVCNEKSKEKYYKSSCKRPIIGIILPILSKVELIKIMFKVSTVALK